jgi:photosystem II stability/assembly factor-like uncharacterized protein
MKKYFLIIFIILSTATASFLIHNSYCQWYPQPLPATGNINQIQFINSQTGWILTVEPLSTHTFLKTTNGGANWQIIHQTNNLYYVSNFKFFDENLGYATGEDTNYSVHFKKTTDGGFTWINVYNASVGLGAIFFLNPDSGWVSGGDFDYEHVYFTTNGGQSFSLINVDARIATRKMIFTKTKYNGQYYGWRIGSGYIDRTTNSGYNWQWFSGITGAYDVHFVNKDTGWVTSQNYNYILYTSNNGASWVNQYLPRPIDPAYILSFTSPTRGWAGSGYFRIYATTNSGFTWGMQIIPFSNGLRLFFVDSNYGWAGGICENFMYTTNGGGTIISVEKETGILPDRYALKQNYPNPFNSETTIIFSLKERAYCFLYIYDIMGKEVYSMSGNDYSPGEYKIKPDFSKLNLSSGIYFYKLLVTDNNLNYKYSDTKKAIYLK